MHYAARAWHSWRDSAGSLSRDARATRHAEIVRRHDNGPTKLEGKAAPLARRRLGEQRTPLERQLTGEYGRARLHGARASCRGAFSNPTEYINASGWLTTPRLEVLDTRPVAGAGSGIRQLKIGLGSARYCSAEEHTTPCTHGAPYGHVLAAPGGARRPPEPNTTIGLCRRGPSTSSPGLPEGLMRAPQASCFLGDQSRHLPRERAT